MTENQYKVVQDNLGEYSVLRPDNSIVCTALQYKATAELFCDELNELHEENTELHIQNDFLNCESRHFREVLQENRLLKSHLHTVLNNYTRRLKRHTIYFEIIMDLARDLGIDIRKLEALDD